MMHQRLEEVLQYYCPNHKLVLQEYQSGKTPSIFKLKKGWTLYGEDRIENSNFKSLVLMTFSLGEQAPEIVKAWYEWFETQPKSEVWFGLGEINV